ncbi:LysE family translocator [Actinomadura physcomitrii]|uniref:LysE family translocator n=1 Tax=Actinomadura physcomitrii TaxID=2650748 RepID=UPI001922F549|nr:LysE family transporter [Actinomadura physcomitrii]
MQCRSTGTCSPRPPRPRPSRCPPPAPTCGPRAGLLATAGVATGEAVHAAVAPPSNRRAYLNGLVTNLLRPKMVTFSIAFLPQFIDPESGRVRLQFAVLGTLLVVLEFLVDGTVGVLAARIGEWLRRRRTARRRLDVATGSLFIDLGLRLAARP